MSDEVVINPQPQEAPPKLEVSSIPPMSDEKRSAVWQEIEAWFKNHLSHLGSHSLEDLRQRLKRH